MMRNEIDHYGDTAEKTEPVSDEENTVDNRFSIPGKVRSTASDLQLSAYLTKKNIVKAVISLIAILITWYTFQWWTVGRFVVSTNDAYIKADKTTLAAKISGYVSSIEVKDNAHVKKGDIIAKIEDGDYQLAIQAAKDNIASQKARIARIDREIKASMAALDQAKAQLSSAQANALQMSSELKRKRNLAKKKFTSGQSVEQAEAENSKALAGVANSKATIQAARAQIEVTKARKLEAIGVLKQLNTALAKAKRDLTFTLIKAPYDGVVGNRAIQVGDYVRAGQRLASLIRLNHVYIDANFKETQIVRLKPGQIVEIEVDALPDRTFHGRVVSMAPASGSEFSLFPANNATGNFTKVVQRVPVRIHIDKGEHHALLRPGLSVVVNVNTKHNVGAK